MFKSNEEKEKFAGNELESKYKIKLQILHNWLYAPQMFNWYKTTLCIAVRN